MERVEPAERERRHVAVTGDYDDDMHRQLVASAIGALAPRLGIVRLEAGGFEVRLVPFDAAAADTFSEQVRFAEQVAAWDVDGRKVLGWEKGRRGLTLHADDVEREAVLDAWAVRWPAYPPALVPVPSWPREHPRVNYAQAFVTVVFLAFLFAELPERLRRLAGPLDLGWVAALAMVLLTSVAAVCLMLQAPRAARLTALASSRGRSLLRRRLMAREDGRAASR